MNKMYNLQKTCILSNEGNVGHTWLSSSRNGRRTEQNRKNDNVEEYSPRLTAAE